MVFSFFRKPQPEKRMVARPAAVPRPGEDQKGEVPAAVEDHPRRSPAPPPVLTRADIPLAEPVPKSEPESLGLSELEVSVEEGLQFDADPVDAEAEQAAILYANGQDAAARTLLEKAARVYRSGPGERLWLMLFDVLRLTGEKSGFEALGLEYAECFEKSPPVWRGVVPASRVQARASGTMLFKGELTGDNDAGFEAVQQALAKTASCRLDLSKVRRIDTAGCERLVAVLERVHRARRELDLVGRGPVASLLDARVVSGCAENRACWLLKLEFLQLSGPREAFEDLAIEYAVTFEISPPSWEPRRVMEAEPLPIAAVASEDLLSEAYQIRGEIRAAGFGDLMSYADANDPVLVDCAAVTRMDFVSAGKLLNLLTNIRRKGKKIVLRHPNHLVAELFRVVKVADVAEVILARN